MCHCSEVWRHSFFWVGLSEPAYVYTSVRMSSTEKEGYIRVYFHAYVRAYVYRERRVYTCILWCICQVIRLQRTKDVAESQRGGFVLSSGWSWSKYVCRYGKRQTGITYYLVPWILERRTVAKYELAKLRKKSLKENTLKSSGIESLLKRFIVKVREWGLKRQLSG